MSLPELRNQTYCYSSTNEAAARIFVGDIYQLPPVVISNNEVNPFFAQTQLSAQARIQKSGAPIITFRRHFRSVPQIMELISQFAYHGALFSHDAEAFARRPQAQAIADFNQNHFGIRAHVVYFNMTNSTSGFTPSRSCNNDDHVKHSTNLVKQLIEQNITDIAILVGYEAQNRAYISAISKLAADIPKIWNHVQIDKIDKSQGAEFNVVIADFSNTKAPGFMAKLPRANAIISRAINGLYVLMNSSAIRNFRRTHLTPELLVGSLQLSSQGSKESVL